MGKSPQAASPAAATWFFMAHFPPPSRRDPPVQRHKAVRYKPPGEPQWKARWVGGLPVLGYLFACGINDTFYFEGYQPYIKEAMGRIEQFFSQKNVFFQNSGVKNPHSLAGANRRQPNGSFAQTIYQQNMCIQAVHKC